MDSGIVYYILGVLVLLLLLASWLDRNSNKHRSKLLLLVALAIMLGVVISWILAAITYPYLL